MLSYFQSIWDLRYFWTSLVRIDLRSRYRRSLLGMGWSLLHPICMTTIICVVFYQVFKVDIATFGPFLLAGLGTWSYITGSTLGGCACFFSAEPYIRQQPAPLAIYSLRNTLGTTIHFLIALTVVISASWLFQGFGNVTSLIWLLPALVLLFVFLWAAATVAGIFNVLFPDVRNLLEVTFQLFFYATPIIYPTRVLDGRLGYYLKFNPFVHFVALIRAPILDGGAAPPLKTWIIAGTATCLTVTLAILLIKRFQSKLIFHL